MYVTTRRIGRGHLRVKYFGHITILATEYETINLSLGCLLFYRAGYLRSLDATPIMSKLKKIIEVENRQILYYHSILNFAAIDYLIESKALMFKYDNIHAHVCLLLC